MSALSASVKVWVPGQGTLLSELLSRYATARPSLRPVSLQQYQIALNLVSKWIGEPGCCDEIFYLDALERFTKWMVDTPKARGTRRGQPRSLRTVKGKRDMLLTLWEFAYDRGYCDQPPPKRSKLAPLKHPTEDPDAWSPEQFRRIIQQARLSPPVKWWTPAHWLSLLCVIWYTGERISGLLSCRISDIEGDVLHVRGARTKDKKPGVHRLPSWLADLLRSLPTLAGDAVSIEKSELIWPWPHQINALREHYRRDILLPAELPHDGDHLFHCIRASVITEMVNVAGLEAAQKLARHSSPAITMDHYICRANLRTKSSAELLPNPSRSPESQGTLFE
jgi:integrase